MYKLISFLNGKPKSEQESFAARIGTTIGYLRKAASVNQKPATGLCVAAEGATDGAVTCEELRPDVAWVRIKDKSWPHPHGRPLVDHAPAKEAA
jgi:DNA-binding transcriptional regulator YdaS (Cro superfamily)